MEIFSRTRLIKIGVVLAGYGAAIVAACAAVYVRWLNTQGADAQASAGMYAFGDLLLFGAVFGSVALVPTGLALWFLQPFRKLWTALSIAALAIAATGPFAMALCIMASSGAMSRESPWAIWSALAVLRLLPAPLVATAFILGAFFAPARSPRWALIVAGVIEGAGATYAVLHWFAGSVYI